MGGYYLFHHNHVRKRSTDRSEVHHNALNTEPEVRWVQQQHEKPRYKRDYSTFDQDFVRFPGFRSLVSGTRMAYRDTSTHNIFPDPLFKEQWYLVSAVGVLLPPFIFVRLSVWLCAWLSSCRGRLLVY
uniref:Peptidase S8 pro-domain domain-containing protein n=1 Tax=Anopheles culicifacies TaxID=139723 RepID=A0A182M2I0_9DIPT